MKKLKRIMCILCTISLILSQQIASAAKWVPYGPKNPVVQIQKKTLRVGQKQYISIKKSSYYWVKNVKYKSDHKKIVYVNKLGKMVAKKPGVAYVTVTCKCIKGKKVKNYKKKIKITVKKKLTKKTVTTQPTAVVTTTNKVAETTTKKETKSTTKATTKPTTTAPTTATPTTVTPTTAAPTTATPTTVTPTTAAPTTATPTIVAPTPAAPTTIAPTTVAPTTEATPTTAQSTEESLATETGVSEPTTSEEETAAPTTVTPTEVPTTIPAETTIPEPTMPKTDGTMSKNSIESFNYEMEEEKVTSGTAVRLRDYEYKVLDYTIPGLNATIQSDIANQYVKCDNLTPQGYCFTEDYLIVTEYCAGKTHSTKHNSILVVIDRKSGELLNTVNIGGKYHVGGVIEYGGEIFTCDSGHGALLGIKIDTLKAKLNGKKTEISIKPTSYSLGVTTSCVTYNKADGLFYIPVFSYPSGNHENVGDTGMLYSFSFENGTFVKKAEYTIPNRVQSVCFSDDGSTLYMGRSYVRNPGSVNYISQVEQYRFNAQNSTYLNPQETIIMPPMVEQINYMDQGLCMIFESNSVSFSGGIDEYGVCDNPIDKLIWFPLL